ncbi:MAG: inosine/xanthosine triphosphatase [Myxococcota bacterium]
MRVIVASQNPVKIRAAEAGFQNVFADPSLTIDGVSVPSGVSDQPLGDDETLTGAHNRAARAAEAHSDADYTVGIEGGCTVHGDDVSVYAWVVVRAADGTTGRSKTATFYLPREVGVLVRDGLELGDADDQVFGQSNSKQANGSVGLLTGDRITRETYYTPAIIMALIPFMNPELTFITD